VKLIKIKIN